jgi:hypothetical protein
MLIWNTYRSHITPEELGNSERITVNLIFKKTAEDKTSWEYARIGYKA